MAVNNDELVMRARIVDDASARLQGIANQLNRFSRQSNVKQTTRDFSGLKETLTGVGSALRYSVLPQLALLAVGSGGIAIAIRSATQALQSYAKSAADIRKLSIEMNFAEKSVRSFIAAAGLKGIDEKTAVRGLEAMGTAIRKIRMGLTKEGPIPSLLNDVGGGRELIEKVQRAKSEEEAKQDVIDHIVKLREQRRELAAKRLSSIFFGSEDFASITRKEMETAADAVYQPTQRAIDAAVKLDDLNNKLSLASKNWASELSVSVIPAYDAIIRKIHEITGMHTGPNPSMQKLEEASRNIAKAIEGIKREDVEAVIQAGAAVAKFISSEMQKAMRDFRSLMDDVTRYSNAYKKDGFVGVAKELMKRDPVEALDDEDRDRYGRNGGGFWGSNIDDHSRAIRMWATGRVPINGPRPDVSAGGFGGLRRERDNAQWMQQLEKLGENRSLEKIEKGSDDVSDAFRKLRDQSRELYQQNEMQRLLRRGDTEFGGRLRMGDEGGGGGNVGGGSTMFRPGVGQMPGPRRPGVGMSFRRGIRAPTSAGTEDAPAGAVPSSEGMSETERNNLGLILKYESQGRNVMNYMGRRQGLDPQTPRGYTAQGYYQILNSNWRRLAPKLGIKTPNAMSSSLEDQTKVALALMRERPGAGIGHWANFNPSLRAALRRGEQIAPGQRIGNAFAPGTGADPFSTSKLDGALGGAGGRAMTAKGNVNVTVAAPKGWQSEISSDGMFQDSKLRSIVQMPEQPYYNPPASKGF